jgi:hypothetical protein
MDRLLQYAWNGFAVFGFFFALGFGWLWVSNRNTVDEHVKDDLWKYSQLIMGIAVVVALIFAAFLLFFLVADNVSQAPNMKPITIRC